MDYRIREAVAYIEANYANVISVLDLTRRTNLSLSRLEILFKRELGVPPVRYIKETRIRAAKRMFETAPALRVKEVMAAVGINDMTYFGRQFKRMLGTGRTHLKSNNFH